MIVESVTVLVEVSCSFFVRFTAIVAVDKLWSYEINLDFYLFGKLLEATHGSGIQSSFWFVNTHECVHVMQSCLKRVNKKDPNVYVKSVKTHDDIDRRKL